MRALLVIVTANFLGLDSTAWSAIAAVATVLTAVIALVAAVVALRQLVHSRELAEEQARPYVVVSTSPSDADANHVDLLIQNIGQTAATDVQITIDPPYVRAHDFGGSAFMDANLFHAPVPTMPPKFELRLYLDSIPDHEEDTSHPARYRVTVTYRNRLGKSMVDSYDLDLDIYVGILTLQVHGLHHIAQSLRAWTKKQGIQKY